ncbi:carboxylesterase family protein [Caulobacter segnis]
MSRKTAWTAPATTVLGWASERLVRKQAALGQPSFLYYFSHSYPSADAAGLAGFHASETPFVFGTITQTPPAWPAIPDTAAERGLSNAMLDYWTSFARSGKPSSAQGPAWDVFGSNSRFMNFANAPRAASGFMPGMYGLHEQIMCRRRADAPPVLELAHRQCGPAPSCAGRRVLLARPKAEVRPLAVSGRPERAKPQSRLATRTCRPRRPTTRPID